jgi:ethanolamine utilization microcompartment shell protein EutS
MHFARNLHPRFRGPLLAALSVAIALPLSAQSPAVHSQSSQYTPITTGTSLEATADPAIPRPNTKHCEVTLLSDQAFADFNNKDFSFTPPSDCPGPWSKVILTADFSIQAGVQYDRTAQLFFGNVSIYFGTTAEPLQTQTDTWHVERDLTDYTPLFKTSQTGFASLGNIVGEDGLNSIIFGTFKLEFYPANFFNPAPRTADLVLPLPDNSSGSVQLNNTSPELTQTFTLPTNVENAYLDVIAQSQSDEEQWFFCLPDALGTSLGVCGNTAFRQVDISIDGTPAGVAPIFPWIYTGGIDPGLWVPIPGVQTLNLQPYRVDLTPFAGVLSNGKPHTVGVTVFNAFNFFSTVANLLIYEDHASKEVTGEVTENNLAAPNPALVNNVTVDSNGNATGVVTVTNAQNFTIAGYVNTSHGRVSTKIQQNVNFSNAQTVTSTATQFGQSVVQTSTINGTTTTQTGPFITAKKISVSYPFNGGFLETLETSGNIDETSSIAQNFLRSEAETLEGIPVLQSNVSNQLTSQDSAVFVPSPTGFSLSSTSGQKSTQSYVFKDSLGNCFSRTLTAANSELTSVANQKDCR